MGIGQLAILDRADGVGEERQRPLCGDARIQLAQGAGRTVAWVGQHLATAGACLGVVALETRPRHVDLTAHFQHARPVFPAQAQRNGVQGAQVGSDILTGGAITAGGAANELAILVAQADGQAIELGLDRKHRRISWQGGLDAAHEIFHFSG